MILALLAILIATLLVLGVVADFLPRLVARAGAAGIAATVVVLASVALVLGSTEVTPALPFGPTGLAVHLALDPLAASFLLLLFLTLPFSEVAPCRWAALALAVLAGDALTLSAGVLLAGASSLRIAAGSAICVMLAIVLAASSDTFEAFRAVPPDGWRAAAVVFLVLAGSGLMVRIAPAIAVYLLLRVLLDLCGPMVPLWWGVPIVVAGGTMALFSAWRAACADGFGSVVTASSLQPLGMAIIGIGLALFARAADLPAVTALALQAVWLLLATHALCLTLLSLCAAAVEAGAGTLHLDRLGGLIHGMPVTACCCLVALFAGAALPPGLAFAAFWLLFQSLLAVARIGEPGLQLVVAAVAAMTALSVALAALAAVRLFGVAFLGRPRTPRAAVAEDAPRDRRIMMAGLSGFVGLLGVLPAIALLPSGGWTHATSASLALRTGAEAPGYVPIAVAGLLAAACFALIRLTRAGTEARREPAWTGGFAAPPAWLPFGDPATQYGPTSFSEPLRRHLPQWPLRMTVQRWLATIRRAILLVVPP